MAYSDIQMRAFTEIAYMNLGDKFNANSVNGAPVSLADLISDAQRADLNFLGISDAEIDSWSISAVHDTNDINGFYACVIQTSPSEAAVGFRGSEGMDTISNIYNDWIRGDLGLLNSTCTEQMAEVNRFIEKYHDLLNQYDSIASTGHSLGGVLAEDFTIKTAETGYGLDRKLDQCISFDGPGVSDEYLAAHKGAIQKMNGNMVHYRWSFVGTMLNEMPGVEYKFLEVENYKRFENGNWVEHEYDSFTRHDRYYLVVDPYTGKFVEGEQDGLSKFTSMLSRGIDHMPTAIGNVLLTVVSATWISAAWLGENMFDKNGNITLLGTTVFAGAIAAISVIGLPGLLVTAAATILAVTAFVVVTLVYELAYELVMKVVDTVCKVLEEVYRWVEKAISDLRDAVTNLIDSVVNWFKNTFNNGYRYANENPYFRVNTNKLRDYEGRLAAVYRRVLDVDARLNVWLIKTGICNLPALFGAINLSCGKLPLIKMMNYLQETADEFDRVESEVSRTE